MQGNYKGGNMLRISRAVCTGRGICSFLLLLVSACNPFSSNESGNQFRLEKETLFFQERILTRWQDEQIPYCEQCVFTIYNKKMLPGAMLFRQVNNLRGELVFFTATNIRQGFALPTSLATYAITVKKQGDRFILSTDQQHAVIISAQKKSTLVLDDESYFVWLQENEDDATALDITFWLVTE